jgi:hypothetical protein
MQRTPGKFPDEASTFKTEDASPHTVKMDRNDWRIDTFHDAFESAPEGQQLTNARHLAFRKNANDLPVPNRFACSP